MTDQISKGVHGPNCLHPSGSALSETKTKTSTYTNMRTSHSLARELLAGPDLPVRIMQQGEADEDTGPSLFYVAEPTVVEPADHCGDPLPEVVVLDIVAD